MDHFDNLICTPSDKGNASMHLSCDVNEDFDARALRWNMSKLGFVQPLSEEMGVMTRGVGGLEEESDLHGSVGFMGCEMKELAGGMRIPGSCTYSNSLGGSPVTVGSPSALQSALQKFLPSNNDDDVPFWLTESMSEDVDFYSCDEFRIYEFKVRRCMRGRSHDWTECPFAHPGEKARRRDPRRFHYSGSACPDFRKGNCRKGDACDYAHGVFECWLHPSRYRTQLCKAGKCCTRKVCFFAHTPSQLRLFPSASTFSRPNLQSHSLEAFLNNGSYDGSPLRHAMAGSALDGVPGCDSPENAGLYDGSFDAFYPKNSPLGLLGKVALGGFCGVSQISSPTSTLVGHSHSPPPLSPPLTPSESPPMSPNCSSWSNAFAHRRISSLSGAQVLHRQTAFDPHVALLQVQASLAQSNIPVAVGARGPSPLSSNGSVNRRHLGRLNSMPTVSVSDVARVGDHSFPSLTKELHSPHAQAMNQLIATLQQLELKHAAEASKGKGRGLQSSHQFSNSVPGSPNSRLVGQVGSWHAHELEENPLQTVESGRELRTKIYGRLGKEAPLENESPDFGWVNELVK